MTHLREGVGRDVRDTRMQGGVERTQKARQYDQP